MNSDWRINYQWDIGIYYYHLCGGKLTICQEYAKLIIYGVDDYQLMYF